MEILSLRKAMTTLEKEEKKISLSETLKTN